MYEPISKLYDQNMFWISKKLKEELYENTNFVSTQYWFLRVYVGFIMRV